MPKIIFNQDRDAHYKYDENTQLRILEARAQGRMIGYNLMIKNPGLFRGLVRMLGTFDTKEEALQEIEMIKMCPQEEYFVSGFSDYDGWGEIMEAAQESAK